MKKRRGFTLVEVVVSLALLGIIILSYFTIMGAGYKQLSGTSQMTDDTFAHQEEMERLMTAVKDPSKGLFKKEKTVVLFSGTAYASQVDVHHIHVPIYKNRAYDAFVTQTKIQELPLPSVERFQVGVYKKGSMTPAFPWEDELKAGTSVLEGQYKLGNQPPLYQVNLRWYQSKGAPDPKENGRWNPSLDGIWNPMFSSDYGIPAQWIEEVDYKEKTSILSASAISGGNFYYFEMMPFTFHGKLNQLINNPRILVQKKTANPKWNQLIEETYFKGQDLKAAGTIAEVTNRHDRPTLHLAPLDNKKPEGSLIKINAIGHQSQYKQFLGDVTYQFDKGTLDRLTSSHALEMGVFLESEGDSKAGYMLEVDAIKKELRLRAIQNHLYTAEPFQRMSLDTLDFTKEHQLQINHLPEQGKLEIHLVADGKNVTAVFDLPLTFRLKDMGLKSYSSAEYISKEDTELLGVYHRNYAVHFYDIHYNFGEAVIPNPLETIFVYGSSLSLTGGTDIVGSKAIVITNQANRDIYFSSNSTINSEQIWIERPSHYLVFTSSTQLGNKDLTQKVQIDSNIDFQNGGARIEGKDILIDGYVSFRDSAVIEGETVHIRGDVDFSNGGAKIIAKKVYIEGHVNFYQSALIQADEVYIKGQVVFYNYSAKIKANTVGISGPYYLQTEYNIVDKADRALKVTKTVTIPDRPLEPLPQFPVLKSNSWFSSKGYFPFSHYIENGRVEIHQAKIVQEGNVEINGSWSPLPNRNPKKVIIISKNGDITINTNNVWESIEMVAIALNGQIRINGSIKNSQGAGLKGLFISRDGVMVENGDVKIQELAPREFFESSEDYPVTNPE